MRQAFADQEGLFWLVSGVLRFVFPQQPLDSSLRKIQVLSTKMRKTRVYRHTSGVLCYDYYFTNNALRVWLRRYMILDTAQLLLLWLYSFDEVVTSISLNYLKSIICTQIYLLYFFSSSA